MYNDATYQHTIQVTVVGGGPGLGVSLGTIGTNGTATFTGTAGSQVNGTFRFPIFKNPAVIKGIRVYGAGASGGGVSGLAATFLNGTSTVASGSMPANGTFVDMTLTTVTLDSHGNQSGGVLFTNTNGEMTMNVVGIGTASGSALGSYAVDLLWNNLFTT